MMHRACFEPSDDGDDDDDDDGDDDDGDDDDDEDDIPSGIEWSGG